MPFFFARFLRFINYFSVLVARSHRLLLIENNEPFFRLRLLYARIYYYITRTPTIRNFPLEHDVWGVWWKLTRISNYFCVLLC